MKTTPIFQGVATALITPLTESGIDFDAFGRLIDWQILSGVNALVVVGTTGEGSTLTDAEKQRAIAFSVERAAGRVPVIAGTGSNDTAHAISMSKFACEAGADALLLVTPYYNKATQNGLVAMYSAIADRVNKPIILYNVPSRTGVNIEPETYARLGEHPNIAAVKEANGDISKIATAIQLAGNKLDFYSGNDDQVIPMLALGALGVISVLSNPLPALTRKLCDLWFEGHIEESARLQLQLLPLIHALFSEVNPTPVKAAMAHLGWCENHLRLPLIPMDAGKEAALLQALREFVPEVK